MTLELSFFGSEDKCLWNVHESMREEKRVVYCHSMKSILKIGFYEIFWGRSRGRGRDCQELSWVL
jgi:hypothetical protein